MGRRGSLLVISFAIGCSDEVSPTLVTIQTGAPPALIAFRDEASAEWQALTTAGASTFDVVTTGPYQVVIACAGPGGGAPVAIAQHARTVEDGASLQHGCGDFTHRLPFDLRGRMVQPGMVSFGSSGHGTTGSNWNFAFPVAPGSFDLVMLSGDFTVGLDQIAIRRDVAIAGDTQLGTIDITQEGPQALIPISFTVSNLEPGESLSVTTSLTTGSTSASLHQPSSGKSGPTARIAPDAVLRATDRQRVNFGAAEPLDGPNPGYRSRSLSREIRAGDPTSVTLPESLAPVTFERSTDRLTATWSTLPACDEVELTRQSLGAPGGEIRTHSITLSRTFIDATGATSTALDFRGVPGFESEWRVDPTHDQSHTFKARRRSTPEYTYWATSEHIDPIASARAPGASTTAGELDLALRF